MQPPRQRNTELNYKRIRKINIDPIIIAKVVHSVTKINPLQHLKTRRRPYVEIRQLAMYLIRELTILPFSKIGSFFGKDHATALYAVNTMENIIHFQKIPMFVEYYYESLEKIKLENEKNDTLNIVRHTLSDQDLDELKTMNAELVFNANYLMNIIDKLPELLRERFINDEEFIYSIKQKNIKLAVVQKPERFSSVYPLLTESKPQGQQVRGEDNS